MPHTKLSKLADVEKKQSLNKDKVPKYPIDKELKNSRLQAMKELLYGK
jgi:hypothetical protein